MSLKVCLFFIFNSDGHFVQPSGTTLTLLVKCLTLLVKCYIRNISIKLFENWDICQNEMSFKVLYEGVSINNQRIPFPMDRDGHDFHAFSIYVLYMGTQLHTCRVIL